MGVLWEGVCLNLCVYEGREREREKLKECGKMSVVEGGGSIQPGKRWRFSCGNANGQEQLFI